ncbi:hypothetical protein Hanom_Chr07g00589601 [Helianthus anomalus]
MWYLMKSHVSLCVCYCSSSSIVGRSLSVFFHLTLTTPKLVVLIIDIAPKVTKGGWGIAGF